MRQKDFSSSVAFSFLNVSSLIGRKSVVNFNSQSLKPLILLGFSIQCSHCREKQYIPDGGRVSE